MSKRKYPTVMRGAYLDLTETGHMLWMRDHNPDGWDDETWRAFARRCRTEPEFKRRNRAELDAGRPRLHPSDDCTPEPRGVLIDLSLRRGQV